jgi:hypothetical protein
MLNLDRVEKDERITRYGRDRRQFFKGGSAKPQLFLPNPKHDNTTSVYRTSDLKDEEVWDIGQKFVVEKTSDKKPIFGRADLSSNVILDSNLQIIPVPTPHERHADIVGWPEERDVALSIAQELASQSISQFKPS